MHLRVNGVSRAADVTNPYANGASVAVEIGEGASSDTTVQLNGAVFSTTFSPLAWSWTAD